MRHDREYMIVQRNMDSEELIKTDWHNQESSIRKKSFASAYMGKKTARNENESTPIVRCGNEASVDVCLSI